MSPRTDVSEERRSQILDAARKVISRRGYSAMRMDDIVGEAKISKGLLYWYFKSKDAVLAALVRRLFSPEIRALQDLPKSPGTARERLLRFAEEAAREVDSMVRIVPLTFEFYALAFRNRSVRKVMNDFFSAYFTSMRAVIAQGVKAGEFPGVDPAQAAISIGALVEGVLLLWMFDLRPVDRVKQIRSGVEHLILGFESGSFERRKTLPDLSNS
jgi:AcrR family transcriptional regulator